MNIRRITVLMVVTLLLAGCHSDHDEQPPQPPPEPPPSTQEEVRTEQVREWLAMIDEAGLTEYASVGGDPREVTEYAE